MKKTQSHFVIFVFIVAAIALGNAGSTLYLPAMPMIANALHTDAASMKLSLSLFLLGLGASQLIYGPLSDAYGRRFSLLIGLVIFIVGSLLSAMAHQVEPLLLGRLIEGLGIGCANSAGYAALRDIYSGHALTVHLAYTSVFVGTMPLLAPVAGGYLVEFFGWQSCFYFLAAVALILFVSKYGILPETNLARDPKACHPKTLYKSYKTLLLSPVFMGYALCTGFAIAAAFTMGSFLPFLLVNDLGIKVSVYAWIAGIPAITYLAGSFLGGRISKHWGLNKVILIGTLIQIAMSLIGACLNAVHFSAYTLIPSLFVFMFGIGLVVPTGSSGAMAPFPKLAGFESALLCAFMFGCGALFTGIGSHLDTLTPVPLFALLGSIGVLSFLCLLLVHFSRTKQSAGEPS